MSISVNVTEPPRASASRTVCSFALTSVWQLLNRAMTSGGTAGLAPAVPSANPTTSARDAGGNCERVCPRMALREATTSVFHWSAAAAPLATTCDGTVLCRGGGWQLELK